MRKVSTILLMLLLVIPLTLTTATFAPRIQADPPRIYLEPSANAFFTNDTNVGTKFNITAKVENSPDIGAFQVYMEFNDTILNVTRWYEPQKMDPTYIFFNETTSANPVPPDPGYIHLGANRGRVMIAVNLMPTPPTQPPGNGNGTLCIFEMNITSTPPENSTFTSALAINKANTMLLDPAGLPVPGLIKQDGSYSYTAPPPAPPTAHIWLSTSPNPINLNVAQPFNLTVNINNVSSTDFLIGTQFEIAYDPTLLDVTDFYEGGFLPGFANHGTLFTPVDQPEANKLVCADMILPNGQGIWDMPEFPQGSGPVLTVTFLPLVADGFSVMLTPEPLFGLTFLDVNGSDILAAASIGTNVTYAPVLPIVASNSPIASHFNETFKADIWITNLIAGWKLTYVEFTLEYNSTFLNALAVEQGAFLSQFGTVLINSSMETGVVRVNMTLTPSGSYPSGSGILASITFNATTRPPAISDLVVANVVMHDPDGLPVYADTLNGLYMMHEVIVHPIVVDSVTYNVLTISNASVNTIPMEFDAYHRMLMFDASGWGTPHFVNVVIPNALISAGVGGWLVIVDSETVIPTVSAVNSTHTMLTIVYNFTGEPVFIFGTDAIPEMPASMLPWIFLFATLIPIAFGVVRAKRKRIAIFK